MFNDSNGNHPRHHGKHRRGGPDTEFTRGGGWRHGRGGFGRGRKLSSDELQLVILSLLENGPAHGYELIRAIEERSGGFYTPSPGVIYPALTFLNEAELAEVAEDGRRKSYRLTDEGRARLDADRDTANAILESLGRIAQRMDRVRAAFDGTDLEADESFAAFQTLRRAVKSKRGCEPEEARRITAILKRATDEIMGEGA